MSVRAVVLAAGLGTRLRPLTDLYAKPVLPIDGRPVLAVLLEELASAGVREVTVVTGHLAGQVERLAGDGRAFGLAIRYARQPGPDGSADAAAVAAAEPPYLILGADTVFAPGDVARFAHAFDASSAAGAVAVQPGGGAARVVDGLVERFGGPTATHGAAPLWAAGPDVAERIAARPGSPPYELATAFQQAIDAGLPVAGIEVGPTRDLTAPVDLLLQNFPYLRDL